MGLLDVGPSFSTKSTQKADGGFHFPRESVGLTVSTMNLSEEIR